MLLTYLVASRTDADASTKPQLADSFTIQSSKEWYMVHLVRYV